MKKIYPYNGQFYSLEELSKMSTVSKSQILQRLRKGFDVETAITEENLDPRKFVLRSTSRKHPCYGCEHWKNLSTEPHSGKCCHYILDTGHMRGCEPGKNCTKRT